MQALHILTTAANAVLPIVLLILLGYVLRQKNFLSAEFVKLGNKLVFNICLPAMLFINVYDIESFERIQWDIVLYSCVMVFVIFLLGLGVAVLTTRQANRRKTVFQAGRHFRSRGRQRPPRGAAPGRTVPAVRRAARPRRKSRCRQPSRPAERQQEW